MPSIPAWISADRSGRARERRNPGLLLSIVSRRPAGALIPLRCRPPGNAPRRQSRRHATDSRTTIDPAVRTHGQCW
jgi:hypothetical protein